MIIFIWKHAVWPLNWRITDDIDEPHNPHSDKSPPAIEGRHFANFRRKAKRARQNAPKSRLV